MKPQQARSDERDNNRAFRFGVIAATSLLVLAVVLAVAFLAR